MMIVNLEDHRLRREAAKVFGKKIRVKALSCCDLDLYQVTKDALLTGCEDALELLVESVCVSCQIKMAVHTLEVLAELHR